jgi:hypothetical protein
MWALVLWACAMTGLRCGAVAPPDATVIQAAYEREASSGSALHSKNLRVVDAACDSPAEGRFLCQVTFLSTDDPAQRLYYDIVAAARNSDGWELKSGLCKR